MLKTPINLYMLCCCKYVNILRQEKETDDICNLEASDFTKKQKEIPRYVEKQQIFCKSQQLDKQDQQWKKKPKK